MKYTILFLYKSRCWVSLPYTVKTQICLLAISTLGLFSTKLFGNNNYDFFQVISCEILKTIIGSLTGVSLLDIKFSRYFSYSDSWPFTGLVLLLSISLYVKVTQKEV